VRARVARILHRIEINTFAQTAAHTLDMNDIASVDIETTLPLFFDPYRKVRATGSFILIDPISNATVAAGMIERIAEETTEPAASHKTTTRVTQQERHERFGHGAAAILIVNRREVAALVERTLFHQGWNVIFIDVADSTGDELRAVARTLQSAGIVGIFSAANGRHRAALSAAFNRALLEANDLDASDFDLATSVANQLRSWRDAAPQPKDNEQ
jgi:hypothetical protein